MSKEYLTTEEAAEYLGINPIFVGSMAVASILPLKFTPIGKRRFFKQSDLLEWSKRRDELVNEGKLPLNYGRSHVLRRESKSNKSV